MRDRKTYFLDLSTLLTYLCDQSCELTTELNVSGKVARGSIVLKYGKIVQCMLLLPDGVQMMGETAFRRIEACNQWQVALEPHEDKYNLFSPTQFSPRSAPYISMSPSFAGSAWYAAPLRQKRPLDTSLLQNVPLKERLLLRSVFTMINGRRSSEDIKVQLRLSPKEINDALARLRELDLIE